MKFKETRRFRKGASLFYRKSASIHFSALRTKSSTILTFDAAGNTSFPYKKQQEVLYLSDSNITKKALAESLKKLLQNYSFEKVSVSKICAECGLNRKSFYYHFKDKYDLVNWIYYSEFIEHVFSKDIPNSWELIAVICNYLYANKTFYKKTFLTEVQNSFSKYFRTLISNVLKNELANIYCHEESADPYIEFYTDAFVCSIRKWILQKDDISAQFSA